MNTTFNCIFCSVELENLFIRCKECLISTDICLNCFAKGSQTSLHRNNHEYTVLNLNNLITFSNWSAKQELRLLNSIKHNKELNWSNISDCVSIDNNSVKSSIECKDHFEDWMALIASTDDKEVDNLIFLFSGDPSFNFRDNDTNPWRPNTLTNSFKKLSGYRAARGDFETEYIDKYEVINISDLDFDGVAHFSGTFNNAEDDDVVDVENESEEDNENQDEDNEEIEFELKLCMLKSYHDVLRKRYSIKKFIRKFGLFSEIASNTLKQSFGLKSQLLINPKFYRLFKDSKNLIEHLELLEYQSQLKKRINELNELRENGIRSFKHVKMYKSLKTKRENSIKTSHLSSLLAVIRYEKRDDFYKVQNCKDWMKKMFFNEKKPIMIKSFANTTDSPKLEVKYNPLKIENYPDSDKLNDDEKEFCSLARIQPVVYLRVKDILIQECNKHGFVTYSKARKIAGIDVNKTRKIHNLMLKLNLIKESID